MERLAASSLPMPKTVIADAGYGSEENYLGLAERTVTQRVWPVNCF
jgi:hypothetical protein